MRYDVAVTIFTEDGFAQKRVSFSVDTTQPQKIVDAIGDILHMRFDTGSRADVRATERKP